MFNVNEQVTSSSGKFIPALKALSKWQSITLLTIGFILVSSMLIWTFNVEQARQQNEELIDATQSVIESVQHRLQGNEDFLQLMVLERTRGNLNQEQFQQRISRYITDHPEMINVTWVDSGFVVRDVAPFDANRNIVGLSINLPEPKRVTHLAYEQRAPAYTRPFEAIQGGSSFEVWVPVFQNNEFIGLFGGVYSCKKLLQALLPPSIAQRYHIELRDAEGTLLGGTEFSNTQYFQISKEVKLTPPGNGITLRLQSFSTGWTRLLVLELLCGALGLGIIACMIILRRDALLREQSEAKIHSFAFFDQLTGLPNRILLLDRLTQAMLASSRSGFFGALVFVDLDHFKTLNDTLGHRIGDVLLKQVATRLKLCVHETDTLARVGGDEFVAILNSMSSDKEQAPTTIERVVEKLLASLCQPYHLGEMLHRSTASIGVTLFKGDHVPPDELMKQADMAMYTAKKVGRNAIRFFDPALESVLKARATMEDDLRRAVEEQQFLLYYQDQVVESGRRTGVEALIRWMHPEKGVVSPVEFIPLAEETGLILSIGTWVLETACHQLSKWAVQPEMSHLGIAVNVSAYQFHQPDFVDRVLAALAKTGANPRKLKLELTESLLVENIEGIIEKMCALKAKGIGFSLDDFGTGYSSLNYLKRLPLDQLKIDKSFVCDALSDPNDAAIAKTIIALGESLGLNVIAEGVETEAQRAFLADLGCHAYQGYFFGRPRPPEELF